MVCPRGACARQPRRSSLVAFAIVAATRNDRLPTRLVDCAYAKSVEGRRWRSRSGRQRPDHNSAVTGRDWPGNARAPSAFGGQDERPRRTTPPGERCHAARPLPEQRAVRWIVRAPSGKS
jgi:hypothetical protein